MQNDLPPVEINELQLTDEIDELNDAIGVYTYRGVNEKLIWEQQWLINE